MYRLRFRCRVPISFKSEYFRKTSYVKNRKQFNFLKKVWVLYDLKKKSISIPSRSGSSSSIPKYIYKYTPAITCSYTDAADLVNFFFNVVKKATKSVFISSSFQIYRTTTRTSRVWKINYHYIFSMDIQLQFK